MLPYVYYYIPFFLLCHQGILETGIQIVQLTVLQAEGCCSTGMFSISRNCQENAQVHEPIKMSSCSFPATMPEKKHEKSSAISDRAFVVAERGGFEPPCRYSPAT